MNEPPKPVQAVLYPAIAEAAHRVGAQAVGLIDVGGSAGSNLDVDRVGITYSNGQTLGDPSSPLQLSASIRGHRPVPAWAMPEVVARISVDRDPVGTLPDADQPGGGVGLRRGGRSRAGHTGLR